MANVVDYDTWAEYWDQDEVDEDTVYDDPRDYSPVQYRIWSSRYSHWENAKDRACDAAVTLPLYIYNHGVPRVSTDSFIGRAHQAEWDSGQLGIVYLTKDDIRELYGCKNVTKKRREDAEAYIRAHVEDFDRHLNS